MKDYSEMSDYEINKAVAKIVSTDSYVESYDENRVLIHDYHNGVCLGWKTFNPCNNPSDMWPLMLANGIGVMKYDLEPSCPEYESHKNMWFSMKDFDHMFDSENPLRAAAIVFLMLNKG